MLRLGASVSVFFLCVSAGPGDYASDMYERSKTKVRKKVDYDEQTPTWIKAMAASAPTAFNNPYTTNNHQGAARAITIPGAGVDSPFVLVQFHGDHDKARGWLQLQDEALARLQRSGLPRKPKERRAHVFMNEQLHRALSSVSSGQRTLEQARASYGFWMAGMRATVGGNNAYWAELAVSFAERHGLGLGNLDEDRCACRDWGTLHLP